MILRTIIDTATGKRKGATMGQEFTAIILVLLMVLLCGVVFAFGLQFLFDRSSFLGWGTLIVSVIMVLSSLVSYVTKGKP